MDAFRRITNARIGERIVVGASDLEHIAIDTLQILNEEASFGPGVWLRVPTRPDTYADFAVKMRANDHRRAFRLVQPVSKGIFL